MFHVILHEPEIPPNTGNIIRLCANTGARLHLVKPLGFRLDDKSLQRSGLDYHDLAAVAVHENFSDCVAVIGMQRVHAIETSGGSPYGGVNFRRDDAFLFGSETRGLPREIIELIPADRRLNIPMRPGSRSLNLSNSVAVVVYEAWRQSNYAS
jgi:tRNA (cytidine/uridine-2'-O-)-methyltransferase